MYEYAAKVVRVIDGDTVDVVIDLGFDVHISARVRLEGIDTPETRTRDLEEKEHGIAAKRLVQSYMPPGKKCVIKTFYHNKGKFGRILGRFFVDGESVNDNLITMHLAVRYEGQSKKDIAEAHLKNRALYKEIII